MLSGASLSFISLIISQLPASAQICQQSNWTVRSWCTSYQMRWESRRLVATCAGIFVFLATFKKFSVIVVTRLGRSLDFWRLNWPQKKRQICKFCWIKEILLSLWATNTRWSKEVTSELIYSFHKVLFHHKCVNLNSELKYMAEQYQA